MNKKFLMSIFICLLLGFMCAFIVYKSYNKDKTSFGTENLTKEEQIKELKKQLKRLEEEQRNIKETIELMEN